MTKKHSNYKSEFFDDAQGNKSITRLKTFLAAITFLIIVLDSIFISDISQGERLPVIVTLLAFSTGE